MNHDLAKRQPSRRSCVLGGVDVDAAVAAFRKLPVLADLIDGRRAIQVDVGHTSRGDASGVGGRAWGRRKIRIYGGPKADPACVLEVVLHELVHVALPRMHHGERFRRVFARAAREAWGVDVPIDPDAGTSRGRRESVLAYRQGDLVVKALRPLVAAGTVHTFPPAPAQPKPTRAERDARLVEKRAAHAVVMLRRAERRLKLAKTVQQRWSAKVRYYERQAAKRKS